jgi:hypothetical protein
MKFLVMFLPYIAHLLHSSQIRIFSSSFIVLLLELMAAVAKQRLWNELSKLHSEQWINIFHSTNNWGTMHVAHMLFNPVLSAKFLLPTVHTRQGHCCPMFLWPSGVKFVILKHHYHHYHVHRRLPLVPMHQVNTIPPNFPKIHSNIIFPSMPSSTK